MKVNTCLLVLVLLVPISHASVTLQTQFGTAFDSSGNSVAAGTLWALVVDDISNNGFGFFGADSNLNSSGLANSFFTSNQSIGVGTVIGGNTVFAMGGFDGVAPGITNNVLEIPDYSTNGMAQNLNFAFLFFPGVSYDGVNGPFGYTLSTYSKNIGTQVGGIHTSSDDGIYLQGMSLPAQGFTGAVGAATVDGGGTVPNSSFTAVSLIPEPSAALLGAFGALAMLRRRREA